MIVCGGGDDRWHDVHRANLGLRTSACACGPGISTVAMRAQGRVTHKSDTTPSLTSLNVRPTIGLDTPVPQFSREIATGWATFVLNMV